MGRLLIWILGLTVSFMILPDVSAEAKLTSEGADRWGALRRHTEKISEQAGAGCRSFRTSECSEA